MMLQQQAPLPHSSVFLHQSHTPATADTPSPLLLDQETWLAETLSRRRNTLNNTTMTTTMTTAATTTTPTTTTTSPSSHPGPLPPGIAIRKATLADAPAIAQLGRSVFTDTFGFSIPSNDLQIYLDDAYALPAIEAVIASPTKHIFIATPMTMTKTTTTTTPTTTPTTPPDSSDSDPPPLPPPILGFVQLTENTTEPCLADMPSLVELQRLYVRGDCHGRGLGKALAAHAESLARHQLGYSNVWLGVWEGNFVSQRFYEALGYERVGEHEFTMGRCVQIDWIMLKPLD